MVAPLPVTVAKVEELAMVTVSVAPPVVVISVPAAMVMVSPALMVWFDPEVPAKVNVNVPPEPEVKQVAQPISPRADKVTGVVAETATVPEALGNVQVLSETVKSEEVMIPLKVATAEEDWGSNWMVSELAVEEAKEALLVVVRVAEKAPLVELIFKAPVVSVSPFDAVRVEAEVMVPDPLVEIFPEVVIASPELDGDKLLPVLFQNPSVPEDGGVEVKFFEASV